MAQEIFEQALEITHNQPQQSWFRDILSLVKENFVPRPDLDKSTWDEQLECDVATNHFQSPDSKIFVTISDVDQPWADNLSMFAADKGKIEIFMQDNGHTPRWLANINQMIETESKYYVDPATEKSKILLQQIEQKKRKFGL